MNALFALLNSLFKAGIGLADLIINIGQFRIEGRDLALNRNALTVFSVILHLSDNAQIESAFETYKFVIKNSELILLNLSLFDQAVAATIKLQTALIDLFLRCPGHGPARFENTDLIR